MHGLFVGRGRAVLAKRFEIELGNKEVCIERENPNIFRQEPILDQVFIRYDEQSQNVFFTACRRGTPSKRRSKARCSISDAGRGASANTTAHKEKKANGKERRTRSHHPGAPSERSERALRR
jgi:hypothetical protein